MVLINGSIAKNGYKKKITAIKRIPGGTGNTA
jgi:hypothetical protein